MGIQINGQNDEIRAVDGSGIVRLDVEGNITGNLVGNVTGNVSGNVTGGITTTQITVGDTFLKQQSVGLGETTTVGRNAGVSTATGTIIYNSTSGNVEVYTGTGWKSVNSSGNFIDATGGVITDITDSGKTYRVHTFNGSDNFSVNYAGGENTVEYLVIGGGGSGGGDIGGGGGAGGFRIGTGHTIGSGTYAVTVGAGGGPNPVNGLKGIDSSFDGIIATGGGGGMQFPETPTAIRDGGSGGGKRGPHGTVGTGIVGQGYPGGSSSYPAGAGGGGGAADMGDYGSPTLSGPGGNGLFSTITGTQLQYCGGGGGGGHPAGSSAHGTGGSGGGGRGGYASNPAVNGSANRGGGGGGSETSNIYGALGGSGVVVIRYPIETLELKATGGRVTYANGKTIHTFEGSGHFTVTNPSLTSVDYLVVAGGAGGGGNRGGGGGAGGYLTGTGAPVTTQSYAVTVGAGGGGQNRQADASNGGNSVFSTFTSIGGGRGGGNWNPPSQPARMEGAPGGSGGGAGSLTPLTGGSGTAGQGNNGGDSSSGNTGGGGGGAGGAGANSTGTNVAAPGGAGSSSSIGGSSVTYAAGGAGYGTPDYTGGGGSASNNTGGGGDGGSGNTTGGSGGSGIVIISYPT